MAADGPQIKGGIELNTKSLQDAIKQIKQLERSFQKSSKGVTSSMDRASKGIGNLAKSLGGVSQKNQKHSQTTEQTAAATDRGAAANKRLQSSLSSNINAVSRAEIAQQKLASRIKASALSEDQQQAELKQSKAALDKLTTSITTYGSKSAEAATSNASFKKTMTGSSLAVGDANREFRGQGIRDFNGRFQDLTGSVQLALGPLSGIASRLVALQGLFRRGGIEAATFFGSLTALTIAFKNSLQASQEAETTFLRTESVLKNLGATSAVTAEEVMKMGQNIGLATLTSTKEARDAAVALAGFGGIASDSFERIITTAQGVSEQFGGDLVSSTKYLARALQDPERRLTSLERKIGTFSAAAKDQMDIMIRQGDIASAQALILEELSGSYTLATDAAGGLAGATDTTGELMTSLYEEIGLTSGATKAATAQFSRFNDTFKQIIQGDTVDALGRLLVNAINTAGGAVNFLADNTETLGLIFKVLIGSTVVKAILAFGSLGRAIAGTALVTKGLAAATTALGISAASVTSAFAPFLPLLRAAKIAALILTPVIGGLVTGFLSSGESAKVASPEIVAYAESLDEVIKRARELSKINPGLLSFSGDLEHLNEKLKLMPETLKDLEDQLNSTSSQYTRDQLSMLARVTSTSLSEIENNAGVFSEVLKGSMDIGDAPESLADSLQVLIDRGEGLGSFSYESIIKYLDSYREFQSAKIAVIELTESIRLQEAAVTDAVDDTVTYAAKLERLLGLTRNLSEEYDKEATQLKKLKDQLSQASDALDFFTLEAAIGGDRAEEFGEKAAILERIVANLTAKLEEAEGANKALGGSYLTLSNNISDLNREYKNLNSIRFGGEDMSAQFEIQDAVREASSVIADFNNNELKNIGGDLKLVQGIDESTENFRTRVAQAYGELIARQVEAQSKTDSFAESQKRLTAFMEGQRSTFQAMNAEYAQLGNDAAIAGEPGQLQALKTEYEARKALMTKQSVEMSDFSGQLTLDGLEQERLTRIEKLKEMWGVERDEYKKHLENLNEEAKKQKVFAAIAEGAKAANDTVTGVMDVMKTAGREQTKEYQALAKAQLVISTGMAIGKAIATAPNPLAAIPAVAIIAAKMGAQMASIDNAMAAGGPVTGRGGPTSDSIPAMLSNGEYVINAAAVRKLGLPNLNALNSGEVPTGMAGGGLVAPIPYESGTSRSGGGSQVNIEIVDMRGSQSAPIETQESMSPEGIRSIKVLVRDMVTGAMSEGGTDRAMAQNYGISRQPKRR